MKNASRLVAALVLAGAFLSPASALKKADHVKATLISESESIQPGTPFTVALRFEITKKWHTYWKNPGESGSPTEINWTLPAGFKAGPIQWPAPGLIEVPPVVSYGYGDEVLHLIQITPPADLKAGQTITLKADVDWLECEVVCIPGSAKLNISIPVKAQAPRPDPEWVTKFNEARFKLPIKNSEWQVKAAQPSATSFQLILTPPSWLTTDLKDVRFFPNEDGVIQTSGPQTLRKRGNNYTLDFARSEASTSPVTALQGVLTTSIGWRGPDSETALEIDAPVSGKGAGSSSMSFWLAILFAFLGGLLLNLMPCVLPIISIKILGFVQQSAGNSKEVLKHGLLFGVGVLVSFWVLAGALLALRAGGQQIGWGFQLQSPLFITGLACLFFLMGLNLLGVFEVGESLVQLGGVTSGSKNKSGSFLSGVLATIVATPCTAPFMGSALGYAITLPAWQSIAIFTSLGVGMALPYVILSSNPAFLKFVPKPGRWMETMKQAMGFILIATVVWLAWVLSLQKESGTLIGLLIVLLIQAIAAWIYGRWRGKVASVVTLLVLISSLVIAYKLVQSAAPASDSSSTKETAAAWEKYSPERVAELRQQGKNVFIDFTAAWCLTCQVNKRVAFTNEVIDKFKAKNVVLLRADWTSYDPQITQALEKFGRTGVPFYPMYEGMNEPPIILPEILTPQIVLDALDKIKDGGNK